MTKKSQIITVRAFSITLIVIITIFIGLFVGFGLTMNNKKK